MKTSKKIYSIQEIKELCYPVFQQKGYINKVYIFGSYARQEQTEDSDVDFAVFIDDKEIGLEFYSLYELLSSALNKKVDVLTEEEVLRIMKKNFERDKVLVYER